MMKRCNIRDFNVNLTEKLKMTSPRNYFKTIKMLSGSPGFSGDNIDVEELRDLSPIAAVEKIAEHFSSISCSYRPVQVESLPSYLPAPLPPQVTEMEVFNKLRKLNKTRSTFPIDLPYKLRKE